MTDDQFEIDEWLSHLLEEYEKQRTARQLRDEHPYVKDLIEVLRPYADGVSRQIVLHKLEKDRQRLGLSIPPKFEQTVQSSYNRYCVNSLVYKRRKAPESEGLFHTPGGKRPVRWAVYPEKAAAWLQRRLSD